MPNKKPTFYITTPIYYPSDKLHIGHSYCTVATDVMARYKRLSGYDVMFLTGTDEHGQKIEEKAKAAGIHPQKYVDNIVAGIKDLWKLLNISNDRFIRTTDAYHVQSVQKIFEELYKRGYIYKGEYKGKYCTPCESFWTESQLTQEGNCPDCGRPVKDATEEAYFFKLSAFGEKLMDLYAKQPDFMEPPSRMNEMINNFIKPGLEDLCVSRTSFSWGIPVTFDPGHVVYVWVDALSNYITALGYGNDAYNDYDRYWPASVHFVGKEIIRFHTIIWPAILMALDLPLPKKVFGHGWLLLEGGKMSKSKGNVVDPVILAQRYGVDAIRYFLLREFPFGTDGLFSNEGLIYRINADLANDLGNLVSRSVAMVDKYFGGTLPVDRQEEELDHEVISLGKTAQSRYEAAMERYAFQDALVEVFRLISRCNKYIDETAPWVLGKDENQKARLASVLYNLLEAVRISSILLTPFMPETCPKMQEQIGVGDRGDIVSYESAKTWGLLPLAVTVYKGPGLFPRIDVAKEMAALESATTITANSAVKGKKEDLQNPKRADVSPAAAQENKPEGVASLITIEDFGKVQLRTAKVKACEPVPKAKKLLRLELDDGSGTMRQVVSGIAPWYAPEQLIGKTVVVVANLQPAKLRGVESQGMILAADAGENDVRVLFVEDDVPVGSVVR